MKIVPKASAVVPGAVNVEAVGINRDHIEIVKFEGIDDPEYEKVRGHLDAFLDEMQVQRISQRWGESNRTIAELLQNPQIASSSSV